MLRFFILILLINSAFAQRLNVDDRRRRIIGIIDEELSEASRLAKQQDFKSPDTILRIAELNLEKARHIREAENDQYLAISPEERRKVKKANYFKTSSHFFQIANKSAQVVVKRFPRYKNIGDVHFIIGSNYKELGKEAQAKKNFSLAIKKSPKNLISQKAKLALADYHFNDHQYAKAVPLYESALKHVDERWWTKDAFNLAWSYYRTKKYDRAIDLMKEVHRRSKNEKYVDMARAVERDIGIFFVDSGKIADAVKFYEALGINYTSQFLKIATVIMTQGRFAQAEALLKEAAKLETDRERKIEIFLTQLELFDKYNKIAAHLRVSRELVQLHQQAPLSGEQLKRLIYQVDKKAAELQKATASEIYAHVPKVKRVKSNQSIAYFELSSKLNPGQRAEKTFFQGETSYAAGNFPNALSLYVKAFDEAKTEGNKKIMAQSLEGMLSSLGQKGLSPKVADKLYQPVYTRYLSFDSKSARANSIFVKLFNSQYQAKDISGAEQTMTAFAANFPTDYKTQEGMLAKIMDHYRVKKDYAKVKEYVSHINDGKYKVSAKYANALRELMTKIQIEGVQQSLEQGNKGVALKGYHAIYSSSESTPKAKTNAAYNLAALYFELGDTNKSYLWSSTALKDMSTKDVAKFTESFLSISSGLFLRQNFAQSADLSYRLLAKLCRQNSSNKPVAYRNAVFISLANNDLDKSLEIRSHGKECLVPDSSIADVSLEVLKELATQRRWETFEQILSELEKNSKNYPDLILPYEQLRLEFARLGDSTQVGAIEAKQQKFFKLARQQKLETPVEALDLMASKLLGGLVELRRKIGQIPLRFPENEFNTAMKSKLQLLDQLAGLVNEIQQTGSGKGIVEAYRQVISAYEDFASELRNFTPPDKGTEYVASFQKAMAEVWNPILSNAEKQRKEIRKLIYDNKILAAANHEVLYSPAESFKRYIPVEEVVLMDRGGRN